MKKCVGLWEEAEFETLGGGKVWGGGEKGRRWVKRGVWDGRCVFSIEFLLFILWMGVGWCYWYNLIGGWIMVGGGRFEVIEFLNAVVVHEIDQTRCRWSWRPFHAAARTRGSAKDLQSFANHLPARQSMTDQPAVLRIRHVGQIRAPDPPIRQSRRRRKQLASG